MASEVFQARENGLSSDNVVGGGRTVPRLYNNDYSKDFTEKKSLGISTRDATAKMDKSILESVMGQLSDGMWENSPRMEKYWHDADFGQDENGNVELRHNRYYDVRKDKWLGGRNGRNVSWYEPRVSGYRYMSSSDVRDFFRKKIKQVYDEEKKSYGSKVGGWSADNKTPLDFFHDGVTVADAYSLWKRLKS